MIEPSTLKKVSIIMPTYNRAEYILETIESIRNQTYANWELIIVDDGSEDNTEAIVKKTADERIYFHKFNKMGAGIKLRTTGMKKASGEFIAFMDSDDLWPAQKLEKQLKVFQDYPEAFFSITNGFNFQKPHEPFEYFYKQREGVRFGNILHSFFKSEVAIFPQTLIFKRACIDIINQQAKISPRSDVEFMIGLSVQFNAVILYEPLLERRVHQSNFSKVFWESGYLDMIRIIRSYKRQKLIPQELARLALCKLYINFGEKHLRYQQKGKAIGKFFRAWFNQPLSIVPFKKTGKAVLYFLRSK